jgi:S-adenosyl-L-methionine hydrolase (adenosine-forming)
VTAPVVTLLTDYGLKDDFVGVCHGVIATICPEARIIDINHGVRRHDIRAGALSLRGALPYMPIGVHVAVVDPDVGAERRAVALRLAEGRLLVGPDNGLLSLAAQASAGVLEAVDIAQSPFRLEPLSATFHGRDIFSAVAAHLAAGAALVEAGEPLAPEELIALELPRPRADEQALVAHAIYVDGFGNVQLNADHRDLARAGLKLGHAIVLESPRLERARAGHYVRTFADARPGEMIVYEDAYRMLAVAISHGDAAETLGLSADDELRISSA